jgi:hypothetical protein
MRMARMFGATETGSQSDVTGITIDVVTGLLAGAALVFAIWLLASSLRPQTAHAGPDTLTITVQPIK